MSDWKGRRKGKTGEQEAIANEIQDFTRTSRPGSRSTRWWSWCCRLSSSSAWWRYTVCFSICRMSVTALGDPLLTHPQSLPRSRGGSRARLPTWRIWSEGRWGRDALSKIIIIWWDERSARTEEQVEKPTRNKRNCMLPIPRRASDDVCLAAALERKRMLRRVHRDDAESKKPKFLQRTWIFDARLDAVSVDEMVASRSFFSFPPSPSPYGRWICPVCFSVWFGRSMKKSKK